MPEPEQYGVPTLRCAETSRGQRCTREDGHTGYHRAEESHADTIYKETSVRIWGEGDQPEYPLGSIDDSAPWVVRGEEFRG